MKRVATGLLVLLSLLLPKQNVCDLNQKRQTYLT